MAVPTRPVAGAPIASDWGGVAHDTAVSQDIQSGVSQITITNVGQGSQRITWPRPFGGTPTVVVTVGPHSSGAGTSYFAQTGGADATGADLRLVHYNGTAATITLPVSWIAYGPRA